MKVKYLIIALNIIIVFILVILFLLREMFKAVVFNSNLRFTVFPMFSIILLVLICLEIYFFYNYRLFFLLEREDWPALAYYLEQILFTKGKYSSKRVKILASSYILISDFPSLFKLEYKASVAKPATVYKNALIFGTARIIKGNYKDAADFFKSQLDKGKVSDIKTSDTNAIDDIKTSSISNLNQKDREWIRWFYGFSRLLAETSGQAETEFLSMAVYSRNAFIRGLSSYFLHFILAKQSFNRADCLAAAEKGRVSVKEVYKNAAKWNEAAERISKEFHIALIKKYIDETGEWIYSAD